MTTKLRPVYPEIKRHLRAGRGKASNILRADVIVRLNRIVDRGTPMQANRTLALVRQMFSFGIKQALLDVPPCIPRSRRRAMRCD